MYMKLSLVGGGVRVEVMLQTTQPTSGGAVTAVTNCCANCVEPSRPSNGGPIYRFFWASGPAGWLALLLAKAGDVETNPGPTFVISSCNCSTYPCSHFDSS